MYDAIYNINFQAHNTYKDNKIQLFTAWRQTNLNIRYQLHKGLYITKAAMLIKIKTVDVMRRFEVPIKNN